uniref:Uncharacterized protein n=1 Tax=Arundo donax TaxID=35708 RepID=A0A0A9FCH8_ARUDO
MFWNGRCNVKM